MYSPCWYFLKNYENAIIRNLLSFSKLSIRSVCLFVTFQKVRLKLKKTSPLVIKCKIADCLSILGSFEKKQRIRKFIFKTYDLSLNQYVLKGLVTVFSLGSLICEFQIFLHFIISGRVLYHVICPDLLRSYEYSNMRNITYEICWKN